MSVLETLEGSAFCAGVAMGTASILSVGPNNLTLVREGLVRGRVGLVASTMWLSYVAILVVALLLGDSIAAQGATVRPVLSWLGFLALCWFAAQALRSYTKAEKKFAILALEGEGAMACIVRILVLVWCNPLTYIELLFIPAALSCSFMMPICRILFVVGLFIMATIACYGYAFGGRVLSRYLGHQNVSRMFDLGSGVLLSLMAVVTAIGLILRPT